MSIKHGILKIITTLVKNERHRNILRRLPQLFSLRDIGMFLYFNFSSIATKSVLLVEQNTFHAEVLSGYAKYFLDLGYAVDILCHTAIAKQKPFCGFSSFAGKIFSAKTIVLEALLKHRKLQKYSLVVLTTSSHYFYPHKSVWNKIPTLQKLPLAVVEHNLGHVSSFEEEELLSKNRLITLGRFSIGNFVNPHYFGDFQNHTKNEITHFVVVGSIDPKRKNHTVLFEAVRSLLAQNNNFRITIIGSGSKKYIPNDLTSCIHFAGRLDFPKLFEQLQNADFFLPLLDPDNKQHHWYIKTGVTDSAQLIYGFSLPPLIHKTFAPFYKFNEKNAFLYENDLVLSMQEAIAMNQENYQKKQQNLKMLSKTIYDESLANLQKIIVSK